MSARSPRSALPRARHRGAALLLVLVALVLGVAAATVAAQALATRAMAERVRSDSQLAEEGVNAALAPVEEWLRTKSAQVVLAPDEAMPCVAILDHLVAVDNGSVRVRATAYDERGMLPWRLARESHALSGWLPSDVRSRVMATVAPKDVQAGMDIVAREAAGERRRFPSHAVRETVAFGGAKIAATTKPESTDASIAIGALVATHGDADVALNVNTVPIELLRRADLLAQRDLADVVAESRAQKRKFSAIPPVPRDGDDAASRSPRLVAESDLWAVRIDASSGNASSAWWIVWRRTDCGWGIVQRIRITE